MLTPKFKQFVLNNAIWLIILLVGLFFAIVGGSSFLSGINFINILLHASVLGILTIGQAIVLLSGNFDLSAEGTLSLVTVVGAYLMLPYQANAIAQAGGIGWQLSPYIVIPIMLAIGTLAGFINGIFIGHLKMNAFIVTLAMQLILRGLGYVISKGAIMPGTPATFNWLGAGRIGSMPVSVIVTLVLFVVFGFILKNTRFGRQLYSVGANKDAARASGFNIKMTVTQAYMISGFLAGLAGWMLLGRLQASSPTLGAGRTLETVAAAVIGGISLYGGMGTILGAFSGVLLLSVIADGLNVISVNTFWVDAVRGLIILVALVIEAQKVRVKVHSKVVCPASTPETTTDLPEKK